jgi:hypothetical protein
MLKQHLSLYLVLTVKEAMEEMSGTTSEPETYLS